MTTELKSLLSAEITPFLATVATEQASFKNTNKVYKQKLLADTKFVNTADYEVHVYETPKKEWGYTIIFRKTVDKKNYAKTVGYGVEGEERTNDWQEVLEDNL